MQADNMKRTAFLLMMKDILLKRRDSLRRSLDDELALLSRSETVVDACDEALKAENDSLFSQLAQCENRELIAIEYALSRIRHGLYGVCEVCQASISVDRLRALPYATSCIKCQREMERHDPGDRELILAQSLVDGDRTRDHGIPNKAVKLKLL